MFSCWVLRILDMGALTCTSGFSFSPGLRSLSLLIGYECLLQPYFSCSKKYIYQMGDTLVTALRPPCTTSSAIKTERNALALAYSRFKSLLFFTINFISVWHSLCCCFLLPCYKSFLGWKPLPNTLVAEPLCSKPRKSGHHRPVPHRR